jgi:NAD(P)-dependent dehydrogenase (short-subunit alcohol dehydrogenase family)
MDELQGRSAVVTGAAGGIGLAISEAFCAEGMTVLMVDLQADVVAEQAARLAAQGHEVSALAVDVTDPGSVESAAEAAVERHGGLHVAVNNAGIVNGGLSWEMSVEKWKRILDVNLWGVIHGVQAFVPRILATGQEGHVVNTASMAAVLPFPHIAPYVTSKHAVLGLSESLRDDLEHVGAPVGVSVVMPGMIRTPLNPVGDHPPTQVAANVVDAIRRGRFYVHTDHDNEAEVAARFAALTASRDAVIELS